MPVTGEYQDLVPSLQITAADARARLSGRWPWAIEDALRKYGDVVRIAPNELVFFTPQALHDTYSPAHRGMEVFRKTDFQNRGENLGGLIWEEDPVRHHEVARKVFPGFSARSIRSFGTFDAQALGLFYRAHEGSRRAKGRCQSCRLDPLGGVGHVSGHSVVRRDAVYA